MWFVVVLVVCAPAALPDEHTAAEWAVVEDARDGILDRTGLLEAALILSSSGEGTQDVCLRTFEQIAESARRTASNERLPIAKVRRFVRLLHAEPRSGKFDPECASVEETLTTGLHNCVTSLILTLEFCRCERIAAHGVQQGSHVWLRVKGEGGGDVETTTLSTVQLEPGVSTPISDAQLLSRLLYNQARALHQQGKPANAAERLEWCLLVDPQFDAAERNLRIVMANWAIAAADAGRFSEAMAVTRRAMARFPDAPEFPRRASAIQKQWASWRRSTIRERSGESPVEPTEAVLTE